MNQNKLTFESEKLTVDWISFKFQHLENIEGIAQYLFKIGFNSYQESGKLAKLIKESIFVSSKNKFQVCFVGDNPSCLLGRHFTSFFWTQPYSVLLFFERTNN
jgi:hypothetical protein